MNLPMTRYVMSILISKDFLQLGWFIKILSCPSTSSSVPRRATVHSIQINYCDCGVILLSADSSQLYYLSRLSIVCITHSRINEERMKVFFCHYIKLCSALKRGYSADILLSSFYLNNCHIHFCQNMHTLKIRFKLSPKLKADNTRTTISTWF